MRNLRLMTAVVAVAIVAVVSGCASTVEIDSEPQGAEVRIDGQNVGQTPTHWTDNSIVFSTKRVELRKEGYEPIRTTITRDAQINVGAAIGGWFCAWPLFLWALDYPSHVSYDLVRKGEKEEDGPVEAMAMETEDGVKFIMVPEEDEGLGWDADKNYIDPAGLR